MSGISSHSIFLEYVDLVQILGSIIMWLTRAGLVEGTDESLGNAHTGKMGDFSEPRFLLSAFNTS